MTTINFGCILNETEKRIKCKLTNSSKVVVSFLWIFEENEFPNRIEKGVKRMSQLGQALSLPAPIGQSFDITPIRSTLLPGERFFRFLHIEIVEMKSEQVYPPF